VARKPTDFELGAIMAAGIIFRAFGEPVQAFEIMKEIKADTIDINRVDDLDRDVLQAYRQEVADNKRWQAKKARNKRIAETWR